MELTETNTIEIIVQNQVFDNIRENGDYSTSRRLLPNTNISYAYMKKQQFIINQKKYLLRATPVIKDVESFSSGIISKVCNAEEEK